MARAAPKRDKHKITPLKENSPDLDDLDIGTDQKLANFASSPVPKRDKSVDYATPKPMDRHLQTGLEVVSNLSVLNKKNTKGSPEIKDGY